MRITIRETIALVLCTFILSGVFVSCSKEEQVQGNFNINAWSLSEKSPLADLEEWYEDKDNQKVFTNNINYLADTWEENNLPTVNPQHVWRSVGFKKPSEQASNEYTNAKSIIGEIINVYPQSVTNYSSPIDENTYFPVKIDIPTISWEQMSEEEQKNAKEVAVALFYNANSLYSKLEYAGFKTFGGYSFATINPQESWSTYRTEGISVKNSSEVYRELYRFPEYKASGLGDIISKFMAPNLGWRSYINKDMDTALMNAVSNSAVNELGKPISNWAKNKYKSELHDIDLHIENKIINGERFTPCKEYIEAGLNGINDDIKKVEFTVNNDYISVDIELDVDNPRSRTFVDGFRNADGNTKDYDVPYSKVYFDVWNNGLYRTFTHIYKWEGYMVMANVESVEFDSFIFFYNEDDCDVSKYTKDWEDVVKSA